MKRKFLLILLSAALVLSAIGLIGCDPGAGPSGGPQYTLEGAEDLRAAFGSNYSAPQLNVLRDGEATGYKAKLESAKDPSGKEITVSYSSVTLGSLGTYKLIYRSVGLVGSEYTDVTQELAFEVDLLSEDVTGPTVSVVTDSEYCIWVGREIDVPLFTADDASGLDEVGGATYIELPDGTRSEVTGQTYIPSEAGSYNWVYVVKDALGNETERKVGFEVVEAPEEKENVIGYFTQEFGSKQIESYNADIAYLEDFDWGNGTKGGTQLTTTVAQENLSGTIGDGLGIDYVGAFELRQPYIAEVTGNFDAVAIPVHNPNSYPIAFRAWWYSVVTILPGETIWYAVPSEHFALGNQAMTAGDYSTIYDVTNMTFAFADRWNSWNSEAELLPAGAKIVFGDLVAYDYANADTDFTFCLADLGDVYANSYISTWQDFQTSFSDDDELKDVDLGIDGALVLKADTAALDSACVIKVGFTKYSADELYPMLGPDDYVSFYVKTTSENTAPSPKMEIGWGTIKADLTSDWQEIKVYRDQISDLFLNVDGSNANVVLRFLCGNEPANDITGLCVAITSLRVNAVGIGFSEREEDVLVYANEYGADYQLESADSTFSVDTENTYQGEESSVKVVLNQEGTGGENHMTVTIRSSFIADARNRYDAIVIPVFNGDKDTAGETYVDADGRWTQYATVKGQRWGELVISTSSWETVCGDAEDLDEVTLHFYSYYSGEVSVNIGNIRGEIYDMTVVEDELVYFDQEVGRRQVSGINAELSYTTEVRYEDQAGSTKVVSTRDGAYGEDLSFGVQFKSPYISDISTYDYLEIPIFNPQERDLVFKCFWSDWVTLTAGTWTKVVLSASQVEGGFLLGQDFGDAPWSSGKFFFTILGTGGNWEEDKLIKAGEYVCIGAMMGRNFADGTELVDVTDSACVLDEEAFAAGKGVTVLGGSASASSEGLLVSPAGDGSSVVVAVNPTAEVSITESDVVAVKVFNPGEKTLVVATFWLGDVYVRPGKSATLLIPGKEIVTNKTIKTYDDSATLGVSLQGLGIRLLDEGWENKLGSADVLLITDIILTDFDGGIYSYKN